MEEIAHNFAKYFIVVQGAVVVLIPFVLWHVFKVGKIFPLAVIQILSGILLGPSIFGAVAPDLYATLFDKTLLGGIKGMALVAVSLFAFISGTDADKNEIRHAGRTVMVISLGTMLLTAVVGGVAGYMLAEAFPCTAPGQLGCATGKNPSTLLYAAAFALACAIPALPILVILTRELGLMKGRVGQVSLASAGIGDSLSWASIAIILPFSKGSGVGEAMLVAVGGAALNYAFLRFVATPYFNRLTAQDAHERVVLSVVGVTILISASITGLAGLHPVIGAFMAGVFIPDNIRQFAVKRLDQPTQLVLMPFFFLATGLATTFVFNDPVVWIIFLVALVVGTGCKILGSIGCAVAVGENWRFGTVVGSLLQTKGLMAIVVMTIFAGEQVVSQTTFSAGVVMALVSTAITMPLVRLLLRLFGERLHEPAPPKTMVAAPAPL
jgi:Kef-type K+ transport system membrane component KefB